MWTGAWLAGVLIRRVASPSRRIAAACMLCRLPPSRRMGKRQNLRRSLSRGRKPLVWMTGGPYLSEMRAGQCPTSPSQPPKLEARLAVSDRVWAGQRLYDPLMWPIFLSGTPKGLYRPFYDPPVEISKILLFTMQHASKSLTAARKIGMASDQESYIYYSKQQIPSQT